MVGYLLQNHALDAHGFEEWGAVLGEMVRVRLDSRAFSFGKLLCINFEQPVDRSQAHGGCTLPHYTFVFYRQIGDLTALNAKTIPEP